MASALKLVSRDLIYVIIGFVVSLLIASAVNPEIGRSLFGQ